MIVLDTHALIWWTIAPGQLSESARTAIDEADAVGIPSIAFWETSLLERKAKVDLGQAVSAWAKQIAAIPRVQILPLTLDIALCADHLPIHPDPADRFIAATALEQSAPLITKDRRMHGAPGLHTLW